MGQAHRVFVTGGTGYIGSRLIPLLASQGHQVTALVREESKRKLPSGCNPVTGDALNGDSYSRFVEGHDTFVQLIGVPHPSPAKAELFRKIDLKAGLEAVRVASKANVDHFVYLSVAQPAPMMHPYQAVRAECERAIAANRLAATIVRPWYVLGPGHRWPYILLPLYKLAELIPQTKDGALRLGLVTLAEMLQTLVWAVNTPQPAIQIIGAQDIRRLGHAARTR